MVSINKRTLRRECSAIIIPDGEPILLPAGTPLTITHRLGGSFTVVGETGMFRINGKDADALEEPIPEVIVSMDRETIAAKGKDRIDDAPPEEAILWAKLRTVYDPEIPVNIVDLGLVYSLQVLPLENHMYHALVHMTLTAPGCGMGPAIAADAKERLLTIPGLKDATVEIVWDPPWSQEMISEAGKMELGLI